MIENVYMIVFVSIIPIFLGLIIFLLLSIPSIILVLVSDLSFYKALDISSYGFEIILTIITVAAYSYILWKSRL